MIATLTLAGLLGVVFFAIVTMSTPRLAHHHTPQSSGVASGLNIASFNLGAALGGIGAGWITRL